VISMGGSRLFAVVQRQRGPKWDVSRPMEEQERWDEHAAFMNALVRLGLYLLLDGSPDA
jgi:hypothetical protein